MGKILTPSLHPVREIDWSNPLTKGLSFAWSAEDITLDMVSGKRGTVTGTVTYTPYTDRNGVQWTVVNNAGVNFGAMQPLASKLNCTIVALAAPPSTASSASIGGQRSPSSGARLGLVANSNISSSLAGNIAFAKNNTTANARGASVSDQCDGLWHTFAFAADAVSATAYRYARDGQYQTVTGNDSTGTFVDSTTETAINATPGITSVIAIPISLVMCFNHGMNQQELIQITQDPWQLFSRNTLRPIPTRLPKRNI